MDSIDSPDAGMADAASNNSKLLQLPLDILYLIIPYLDVPSFVNLTSTCRVLHHSSMSQYAPYWSNITRSTFRVPNQPVVENDGKRWQRLYKRLLTQTKSLNPGLRRRLVMRARHVSWPTEVVNMAELGIIADMQCGGWSTNLLTSKGALYSIGVLDGLRWTGGRHPNIPHLQQPHITPARLTYPPGFVHPAERYDSATAIKQFSAGRAHILGLSDSGRIWSWSNIDEAAMSVKFMAVETSERAREGEKGHVVKLVAGWNKSAALVTGSGIVVWEPLYRSQRDSDAESDTMLVLITAVVPGTAYQQTRGKVRGASDHEQVGEVQNFIVLEDYVLFTTHLGKAFAAQIHWNDIDSFVSDPIEVPLPPIDSPPAYDAADAGPAPPLATDVQGSFRSFAIFTSDSRVLTGTQDTLAPLFQDGWPVVNTPATLELKAIPALQRRNVISVAFGDYHFHALHADGTITSYGTELQGCGCLGLGGHGDPEGRLRGLRYRGIGGDATLVPHAYTEGRTVWFEKEKQAWITYLTSGGGDPEEARERMRWMGDTATQGEVSEWIEQEGRAWNDRFAHPLPSTDSGRAGSIASSVHSFFSAQDGSGPQASSTQTPPPPATDDDSDSIAPYFTLAITAAGWHSGALVLVNEPRAAQIRANCLVPAAPKATRATTKDDPEALFQEEQRQREQEAWERDFLPLRVLRWALDTTTRIIGGGDGDAEHEGQGNGAQADGRDAVLDEAMGGPPRQDPGRNAFLQPSAHGATDADGRPYRWVRDHFPRLRLSGGREMPGEVGFDEWRFGRPEWDLEVGIP